MDQFMKKHLIISAGLLILLTYQCKKAESFKNRDAHNTTAISDTISYCINKLGTQWYIWMIARAACSWLTTK
jgi:hypothetical protein